MRTGVRSLIHPPFFLSVGETPCKIFLAHIIISDRWLTNFDITRLIPMMIARVIISLKKVASERQSYLGSEVPPISPVNLQGGRFTKAADGIPLSVLEGEQIQYLTGDHRRVLNPARVGISSSG